MFYFLIFIFLLLMNDNIRIQLLWNYTKFVTNIELYFSKKKTKDKVEIINIYKINTYLLTNPKKELLKKKNYIFHNNKISIKSANNFQKLLIKFKFNNQNFRVILDSNEINNFYFDFKNVIEPKYLSVLNEKNQDITDIINEYSGPERNFYKNKINFDLKNIYYDLDFKSMNEEKFKAVNNLADEVEINNINQFTDCF